MDHDGGAHIDYKSKIYCAGSVQCYCSIQEHGCSEEKFQEYINFEEGLHGIWSYFINVDVS